MRLSSQVLAASTALAAALLTVSAPPASADPTDRASSARGTSASQAADGQARGEQAGPDRQHQKAQKNEAPGTKAANEHAENDKPETDRPAAGSPPGNNGTVKIAPYGEMDGIPDNTPHVGCQFQVEWYGFDATDQGDDVVSTVSFASHAPTAEVALTVDGPSSVPLGGDVTDTRRDGVQVYTLDFDGAPHPQQGYHVKLTIHTPYSHGNDTKTKVFWVEGCEQASTPPVGDDTVIAGGDGSVVPGADDTDTPPAAPDTGVPAGTETGPGNGAAVLGVQAVAGGTPAAAAAVPTAVAAGLEGAHRTTPGLALLLTALGGAVALAGAAARRRRPFPVRR